MAVTGTLPRGHQRAPRQVPAPVNGTVECRCGACRQHPNGLVTVRLPCQLGRVATLFDSDLLRVSAYIVATAVCLFAAQASRTPGQRRVWLSLAFIAGMLCFTRLFGWDSDIADRARHDAYSGGWYAGRRPFQEATVIALLALGGVAVLLTLVFYRPARGSRGVAVVFTAALCAFVGVRAVSLHALDHLFFADTTFGVERGALIEFGLISGVIISGLWSAGTSRYRTKPQRTAPASRVDSSTSPAG